MNADYTISSESFNALKAQYEAEIESIELTQGEIYAAIKLAKTLKWRVLRNETPDYKAKNEGLKINIGK